MAAPRHDANLNYRFIRSTVLKVCLLAAAGATMMLATDAGAYDKYSLTKTAGNCADCHGGFRAAGYVSSNDGVAWNSSLHDAHRNAMLGGDCDACHLSTKYPVRLDISIGGVGFSPISCVGCHGKAEPAAGGAITGAGLRQHHYRTGVTSCSTVGCHADANPATFVVSGENVAPPYYFTPDAEHPGKPTSSCNVGGSESAVAPPLGLDNDGDNIYDQADPNCGVSAVPDNPVAAGLFLADVTPNPVLQRGRYHVTLANQGRARLVVLDIQGRATRTLIEGELEAGSQYFEWDGRDNAGQPAPSGIYFIRLVANGEMVQRKFVFLR